MPKRPNGQNPKQRKGSGDFVDDDVDPTTKKTRKSSVDVTWVKDTTLVLEDDSSTSSYSQSTEDSEDEEEDCESSINININVNTTKPTVNVEYPDQDEFIAEILKQCKSPIVDEPPPAIRKSQRKKKVEPVTKLSNKEMIYFRSLDMLKQLEFNNILSKLKSLTIGDTEVPLKFRVLTCNASDYVKASVLKKVATLEDSDSGENYKLKTWIDLFLRIPFRITIPLPVRLEDGKERSTAFMRESRAILDKAVYGMLPAKTQIMQVLAQWIANPDSTGNVIALQGPAGVGKTSIAKHGIATALKRPFEFFSLGGASDISNFVGHSYTYEGSICGRIADALMHAKCMNPVLYFDELDKISATPHGEEITSMLIHLTDRTQNSQFHDRYFTGIDFDMSQCLFVFSFNDINLVNPILKDRMQVIHCSGYSEKEKKAILENYVWPQLMKQFKFSHSDIQLSDEAATFLVSDCSGKEQGVRTLIRAAESAVMRINMMRISDEETMKEYKFYTKLDFPVRLTPAILRTLLSDILQKEPELWRHMYN
jgi:ATP-dependent Lon protease